VDNADAGARFQAPTSSTETLIAIVEDDAALAGMFRDMLGYAGNWRLHIFSDGQEARTTLPELRADLILLDVGLPNLDGASLYKILRGHSNTKKHAYHRYHW